MGLLGCQFQGSDQSRFPYPPAAGGPPGDLCGFGGGFHTAATLREEVLLDELRGAAADQTYRALSSLGRPWSGSVFCL